MQVTCDISLEYTNQKEAEIIQHTLSVDDDIYVNSNIQNNILNAHINSSSLSSMLQTLDDYLACVSIAEKIIKKETSSQQ
ncbi:MAG: KEOPS complex subunit Pcc1 [Thermoplasmatota archaeon]